MTASRRYEAEHRNALSPLESRGLSHLQYAIQLLGIDPSSRVRINLGFLTIYDLQRHDDKIKEVESRCVRNSVP